MYTSRHLGEPVLDGAIAEPQSLLDHVHEAWRGHREHRDPGIQRTDRGAVSARLDRADGPDDTHAPVDGTLHGCASTRLDDAEDRDVEDALREGQPGGGGRVAGDDDELHPPLSEPLPDLEHELPHFGGIARVRTDSAPCRRSR